MPTPHLILASGSPRRRWLLTEAGVTFTVIVPLVEEIWEDDDPANTMRLAVEKAQWTAELLRHNPPNEVRLSDALFLLAADTIVLLNGRVLGKPDDEAEAVSMLTSLAGREHSVTTGVAVINPAGQVSTLRVDSQVRIRPLTASEITAYVATGSPLDKAGAYAVQDEEWNLVERVVGSRSNVIGLPVAETLQLLKDSGWKS